MPTGPETKKECRFLSMLSGLARFLWARNPLVQPLPEPGLAAAKVGSNETLTKNSQQFFWFVLPIPVNWLG